MNADFGPPPENGSGWLSERLPTVEASVAPGSEEPLPAGGCDSCSRGCGWCWQVLPEGILYRSYLAGVRESRFASQVISERNQGLLWDVTLGARMGVLRYGNQNSLNPEGFQIDIEGAALPRLDLEEEWDVLATDYRFGLPITYGAGQWRFKTGYYHYCSHLGDELLVSDPSQTRINYVRDGLVLGASYYCTPEVRLYGETAWGMKTDGGAEPWEFQLGWEYAAAGPTGMRGAPFVAMNAHLLQELDFGGNFVAQAGWMWRGARGTRAFRTGLLYFNGKSPQAQFFRQSEEHLGWGMWHDF